jgi:hypothetical protein
MLGSAAGVNARKGNYPLREFQKLKRCQVFAVKKNRRVDVFYSDGRLYVDFKTVAALIVESYGNFHQS